MDQRQRLASHADEMLKRLDRTASEYKDEFGDTEFHKRYKKADLIKMPELTKAIVDKAVKEMEDDGYTFERETKGTVTSLSFSVKDVIAIYRHRGVPAYREKNNGAYVVFVGNLKGGVSKTVSTVTLSHGLRTHPDLIKEDLRILVIDLDPQSSATMFMNYNHSIGEVENTAVQAMLQNLSKEVLMDEFIVSSIVDGVDVMPSSIDDSFITAGWDALVDENCDGQHKANLLKENVISKIADEYDFIFVDSGPHMDAMLENAIVAADLCITPIPPTIVDFHSTLKYLQRLPEIVADIEDSGAEVKWNTNIGFMAKIGGSSKEANIHSKAKEVFGGDMLDANLASLSGFVRSAETFDTVISVNPKSYDGDVKALKSALDSAYNFSKSVFDRIEYVRKVEGT